MLELDFSFLVMGQGHFHPQLSIEEVAASFRVPSSPLLEEERHP